MVREILPTAGTTYKEYSILPGYSTKDCIIKNISLETDLAGIRLKIPILSAAMMSVTGHHMALALGKEGGLAILPTRMPIREQLSIVEALKKYDLNFVHDPVKARETDTIQQVLGLIEDYGYSTIPIVDQNNVFQGMITHQYLLDKLEEGGTSLEDEVLEIMIPNASTHHVHAPNISVEDAKNYLKKQNADYLVVLDKLDRLTKIAFHKDIEKLKVGIAISTHPGWREIVQLAIKAGADLIAIDSSDGYYEFQGDVLDEYKKMKTKVPICAGNVVTKEGALYLMKKGADIIKAGMSVGSICITHGQKRVGRAPIPTLKDMIEAQQEFYKTSNKYVPIVMDGGMEDPGDMAVALAFADAVMLGGYLNKFYEAAGEKYDKHGKTTTIENQIATVATWGEGSARAKNMDRYGQTRKTFFEEGVEGKVDYAGRLKPTLNKDLTILKAVLSNAGCMNLKEFREKSVLEYNSLYAKELISKPHNVKEA